MDYRMLLNSREYWEFMSVSKKLSGIYRKKKTVSSEMNRKFRNVLDDYRCFLDDIGARMPVAKYPFVCNDRRTWKYIDCNVNKGRYIKAIINPGWIYNGK